MTSCNIRFFKKGNFNSTQRKYLWPVVNHRYVLQHKELLQSLKGEPLILAGDGRCDSPGHNAKYGTYSIMHVATEKVLDFSLVQVVNNSRWTILTVWKKKGWNAVWKTWRQTVKLSISWQPIGKVYHIVICSWSKGASFVPFHSCSLSTPI